MVPLLSSSSQFSLLPNGDCGIGSQSDNMVGIPHGFIIHWVVIFKNIKKVTEIVDVKNGKVDNSWLYWSFVSSFERDSPVSSMKFKVRSGSNNGSTSSELEARVCIQGE
ncbi:hypothetical protein Tco_0377512 [Tanacetum coccineum]